MSIEKSSCEEPCDIHVSCDYGRSKHCRVSEDHDNATFLDVIHSLRTSGWQIYQELDNTWNHTCPDCVEYKKQLAMKRLKASLHDNTD